MTDEVFTYTTKILKLLTKHIQTCRSPTCCIGKLVDNLDLEKDDKVKFDE